MIVCVRATFHRVTQSAYYMISLFFIRYDNDENK